MDNRSLLSFCGLGLTLIFISLVALPGTADGACTCGSSSISPIAGTGDYCCTSKLDIAMGSVGVNYCCNFEDYVQTTTGLSIGAIVGIAIGCLAAVVIFFVVCCCCCGWCTLCTCCC